MEKFTINPENYKDSYIKNLNECFNGWGGEKEYNWVFSRKVGAHSADIMLIENEEDGVIAGSGVSYRKLSGNGKSIEIGIMTGSWTLPAARRKGCFTKIINCSKDLCDDNDVPFLTAFVTETNASCRRLESEGSFMFPTYHLFSPEVPYEGVSSKAESISDSEELRQHLYETFQERKSRFLSFDYSYDEFCGQYLSRIKETTILKINNDYAVLEGGVNEIKVLLLTYGSEEDFSLNMQAVTNWCLENRSKKAFFYTTREELFKHCTNLGFKNLPGFFTILSSTDKDVNYTEIFRSLNINMADKM